MFTGAASTGSDPKEDKFSVEKPPAAPILESMSSRKASSSGRVGRDEPGDPSEKALKATIIVCLVGLVAVYLFAFSPRKGAKPTAASVAREPQAKEATASFDRESLSTKSR